MPTSVNAVAVSGSWAYVAAGNRGVEVVNLSNPSGAVLEKSLDVGSHLYDIRLQGPRAYFMSSANKLSILDLADPANPRQYGALPGIHSYRMTIAGSLIFGIDAYSLTLIDIADPARPVLLGETPMGISISGGVGNIEVSGDYAFIANRDFGLSILDVSDPLNPTPCGQVSTGPAQAVALAGSHAYVACAAGLAIVDVSYPRRASVVKTVAMSYDEYSAQSVSVSGNYAYVCDQRKGIQVVDIRDPEKASLVRTATPYLDPWDFDSQNQWPSYTSIALYGPWAIAPTATGNLSILNISDPAAAVISAELLDRRDDLNGGKNQVVVAGGFAYVTDSSSSESSYSIKVLRLEP
jgi:hypothetical protein